MRIKQCRNIVLSKIDENDTIYKRYLQDKVYTKLCVFLNSVLAMLINLFKNCQNLDQLIKVCLFLGRNVGMALFRMHEKYFFHSSFIFL